MEIKPERHVIDIIAGTRTRRGRVVRGFQPAKGGDTVTFKAVNTDVTLLFFQGNPFEEGTVERLGPNGLQVVRFFITENESLSVTVRAHGEAEIYPYRAFCHKIGAPAEAGSDPEILIRG